MDGIHTLIKFEDTLKKIYGLKRPRCGERISKKMITSIERIACRQLTARQLECFSMYYNEKLTIKQIAEELYLTSPTVCKHLQRARARLYRNMKNFVESKSSWS